ncbi:hypothetical protein Tco_0324346 [Tanacetum coccineum]
MAYRVDYSFVDTVDASIRDTERRTMAAIEVVNLRVSYQADVHKRESLEFYAWHQDAQTDHAAVRAKIEILRIERLAYERERERITMSGSVKTPMIMRLEPSCVLEAEARVDTLEDTGSSS